MILLMCGLKLLGSDRILSFLITVLYCFYGRDFMLCLAKRHILKSSKAPLLPVEKRREHWLVLPKAFCLLDFIHWILLERHLEFEEMLPTFLKSPRILAVLPLPLYIFNLGEFTFFSIFVKKTSILFCSTFVRICTEARHFTNVLPY